MKNITHIVAVFAPLFPPAFRGGGPIRSIEALVKSAPAGLKLAVLTSDRDLGDTGPLPIEANTWLPLDSGGVYYATLRSPLRLWTALIELRRQEPEILHFNSFMNARMTILPLLLWRIGFWGSAQILMAPRGEFGDGAMKRHSFKKRGYIAVFRLLRIHRSTIWHSTAAHETADIRRIWGDQAKILQRENETLLAAHATPASIASGSCRAVFLGRIVAHKGLLMVLAALSTVRQPLRFNVYGSREDEAYAMQCERLAAELPSHIVVNFHGPLAPDAVVGELAEHDLLLMPTAGENFGHVIAEALSASCFVVTTPHTPWTAWLDQGGGTIVDRNPGAWAEAIERLASEGTDQRLIRRQRAGMVYETWLARPRPPHIWALVLAEMARRQAEVSFCRKLWAAISKRMR